MSFRDPIMYLDHGEIATRNDEFWCVSEQKQVILFVCLYEFFLNSRAHTTILNKVTTTPFCCCSHVCPPLPCFHINSPFSSHDLDFAISIWTVSFISKLALVTSIDCPDCELNQPHWFYLSQRQIQLGRINVILFRIQTKRNTLKWIAVLVF